MREMKELDELIRFAQRLIGTADDGIIGKQTEALVDKSISRIPFINKRWNAKRKVIALVQFQAASKNIEVGKIDGLFGTMTSFALDQLLFLEKYKRKQPTWRDEDNEKQQNQAVGRALNPHSFPKYKDIRSYYGEPASNLKTVSTPYALKLAWDIQTKVSKITCNKKVANSLVGILEDIRDHYGLEVLKKLGLDLYGGAFNNRKMRGGRKLSTHAWGVAIDLDPARNRLRWNRSKAQFAKPEYSFLLDAFAAEGWVSLGEAKDYDWMHFQAVRV